MPINNVNEISTGMQFPPESQRSRYTEQDNNYRLSEGNFYLLVNKGDEFRIRPRIFRFIENFWVKAVISDTPVFDYPNPRTLQAIEVLKPSLIHAARAVVRNYIRYGVGLLLNTKPGMVTSLDPRYWYPVRDAADQLEGTIDIIAYPWQTGVLSFPNRLRVEVISPGTGLGERVDYSLDSLSIGKPVTQRSGFRIGNPAIIPLRNGDKFYGSSDFGEIRDYVVELLRRETSISEALDSHARPHLAVPDGVLQTNLSGEYIISTDGMVIPVPEGSNNPSYVTWDAKFESQENAIERAEDRIMWFTSIAPVLVDPTDGAKGATSGAALRRMAIPTVQRIRMVRNDLDTAFRDTLTGALDLMYRTGGEFFDFDPQQFIVNWSPELSGGITDEADSLATLVGSSIITEELASQIIGSNTSGRARQST